MEIDYKSSKLKKQLTIASETKKSFGVNAKRVIQRMTELKASNNLAILQSIPAANCHPLVGNKNGEWALDISANHRIIFIINQDPIPLNADNSINTILITDVKIISAMEDYH